MKINNTLRVTALALALPIVFTLAACSNDNTAPETAEVSASSASGRDVATEEANHELVVDFYESFFVDHDISAADVIADDYIQHNPFVPDGKAPFVGFFEQSFKDNPDSKGEVIRSATDGDLVYLHVHSNDNADDLGTAGVDIFRVEDGMIVEHWDVNQPVPDESANENTMF